MRRKYFFYKYFFSFLLLSVVYFRYSLLITLILIVNTIIVQGLSTCSVGLPNWVENTTHYMHSNRYGSFFITKHLVKSVRLVSYQIDSFIFLNEMNVYFRRTVWMDQKMVQQKMTLIWWNRRQTKKERKRINQKCGAHLATSLIVCFLWHWAFHISLWCLAWYPKNSSTAKK